MSSKHPWSKAVHQLVSCTRLFALDLRDPGGRLPWESSGRYIRWRESTCRGARFHHVAAPWTRSLVSRPFHRILEPLCRECFATLWPEHKVQVTRWRNTEHWKLVTGLSVGGWPQLLWWWWRLSCFSKKRYARNGIFSSFFLPTFLSNPYHCRITWYWQK